MTWLLLVYRIPREPTAGRVFVWRKLKQLGAVAVQDAAWALPASDRHREQLQWLAAEIVELGGEATLFDAALPSESAAAELRERFEAPVRASYERILAALQRRKPDLAALGKRYQQTKALDFFRCPLAEEVREGLLAARGEQP
jgi:hypothetical protein